MGSKLNTYAVGNNDLTAMMASENALTKGFHQVSLTNWSTTAVPQIALGSLIECDGALYQSTVDESIGGSTSDGTLYIKTVPSSNTVTFEFSTTAPTWDTSKQGWYTSTSSNERYLNFELYRSSSNFIKYRIESPTIKTRCSIKSTVTQSMVALTKIIFNTTIFDNCSEFDTANYKFTAKKNGWFDLDVNLVPTYTVANGGKVYLYKNGSAIYETGYGQTLENKVISRKLLLAVGDYIEIYGVSIPASSFYIDTAYFEIAEL